MPCIIVKQIQRKIFYRLKGPNYGLYPNQKTCNKISGKLDPTSIVCKLAWVNPFLLDEEKVE